MLNLHSSNARLAAEFGQEATGYHVLIAKICGLPDPQKNDFISRAMDRLETSFKAPEEAIKQPAPQLV